MARRADEKCTRHHEYVGLRLAVFAVRCGSTAFIVRTLAGERLRGSCEAALACG